MPLSIIEEFCKTESDIEYGGGVRKRRSVLLQMQKDLDYNFGIYKAFKTVGLSQEQIDMIGNQLAPLFVVPLLYCSAIDLIGRVKHKGSPRGMNGVTFKDSAKTFFGFSTNYANILWDFRNSITHQYSIKDFTISRSGSSNVIELHGDNNDRKVIFVRAMRSSLKLGMQNLETYLNNESSADKQKTEDFLEEHGFTYYLIV